MNNRFFSAFFKAASLTLPSGCSLRCCGCSCWKKKPLTQLEDSNLSPTLNLEQLAKKTRLHIWGASPSLHPDIERICRYLHQKGRQIYLWTHAHVPIDRLAMLSPFVYSYVLYFPYSEATRYQAHVGYENWAGFMRTYDYLSQDRQRIALCTPVTVANIDSLPQRYEFAYNRGLPLIIYYEKSLFERDSLRYLTRFYAIRNVYVFAIKKHDARLCQGVAGPVIFNMWELMKNGLAKLLRQPFF